MCVEEREGITRHVNSHKGQEITGQAVSRDRGETPTQIHFYTRSVAV